MNENECCTLHFKICRLQLNLLQHQDDNLDIDHSEVVQHRHQHFITFTWFSIACNVICGCGILLPSAVFLEIH